MSSTDREAQVVAMLDELDRLDATTNPKENNMSSTDDRHGDEQTDTRLAAEYAKNHPKPDTTEEQK